MDYNQNRIRLIALKQTCLRKPSVMKTMSIALRKCPNYNRISNYYCCIKCFSVSDNKNKNY